MTIKNTNVAGTAKGTITNSGSAAILTQAQTANGVMLHSVSLVGSSGHTIRLSIGGSVVIQTGSVTFQLDLTDIYVKNEAVTVSGSGTGTGYYTVTYEFV